MLSNSARRAHEKRSTDDTVNTRGYGNIAVSFIDEITRLDKFETDRIG